MASILPGFEYDIFISYRQNDNKYDRWVTEFVDNLRKELEATFKNPVSIYFDENPHDGLLETHSVDESLAKKLKCLVLIPIVSQTYCDEKCFAWQHEFIPFYEMAKDDELGLNINLRNGNVASRVLPIQIHELDLEDKSLLESIIGPIRSIKFIYQSAGVNRPLRIKDDDLGDNQNKTNYRNQINKVANALKEIGTGLLDMKNPPSEIRDPIVAAEQKAPKKSDRKWVVIPIFIFLIAALGWLYKDSFTTKNQKEASIAVLPFRNDSDDENNIYFCNALMEDIISQLAKNKEIRVPSSTSMIYYREHPKPLNEIIEELDVNYLLEGNVRKLDDKALLSVTLIDAENNERLWSDRYEINLSVEQLWKVQLEIATEITKYLDLAITMSTLENIPTTNYEAYDLYLQGRDYYKKWDPVNNQKAVKALRRSVSLAPEFIEGLSLLSQLYGQRIELNGKGLDSLKHFARRLEDIAPDNFHTYNANAYIYALHGDFESGLDLYRQAAKLNPNAEENFTGWCLQNLGINQTAFDYAYNKAKNDPNNVVYLVDLMNVTSKVNLMEETIFLAQKALTINPQLTWAFEELEAIAFRQGDLETALEYARKALDIAHGYDEYTNLGYILLEMDSINEAEEAFIKVLELSEMKDIEIADGLFNYSLSIIQLWDLYEKRKDVLKANAMKEKLEVLLLENKFYESARVHYIRALFFAKAGETSKTIESLKKWNFKGGTLIWGSLEMLTFESILSSVIEDPEIQLLIKTQQKILSDDKAYILANYELDSSH